LNSTPVVCMENVERLLEVSRILIALSGCGPELDDFVVAESST
jgi:hypothetical protein